MSQRRSLLVAAVLILVEALALLWLGARELAALHSARLVPGVSTTAFFFAYGLGLASCAYGLARERRWSRAPLVLSELIALGVASNALDLRPDLAVPLGLTALAVLVLLFLPSTTAALTSGD